MLIAESKSSGRLSEPQDVGVDALRADTNVFGHSK